MSKILKNTLSIAAIQELGQRTIAKQLGIEYLEVGDDYLLARMPVDERTHQPFGLLHGGASVVLGEDMGSLGAILAADPADNKIPVGLEINANHIKGVRSGWVYGRATPIHVGKATQIWEIRITDEKQKLVCIIRLTVMMIDKG
jgi:1,4-dihydroxy-2-naphthoyl-CoA hydrolase